MRQIFILIFVLFLNGADAAPKFIAPDESYPLIRRDKLPLDVHGISTLGDQLALLADGPFSKNGRELHNRARMLALSLRLSPAQPRARSIQDSLSSGEGRPKPDKREVKEANDAIARTAEWLVKLPPGEEGFLLGQLLLDIISVQDKDHHLLPNHAAEEQDERWTGLIAPLEQFENKPKKPDSKEAPGNEVSFKTESVLTWAPMFSNRPAKGAKAPGIIRQLILVISKGGNEEEEDYERVRFQPRPTYDSRLPFKAVTAYYKTKNQSLPKNTRYTFNTGDPAISTGNEGNLSGPMALLVDAAITGRPLRRNTYLFANLEEDGTLSRPHRAWTTFLALAAHQPPAGSRLILPPGVSDELESLLVLEKADFFVKYEVLGANTFDEARNLFYEDATIEPALTAAMIDYEEVLEKALEASSIQTFVSHNSVKGRLAQIVGKSSRHLSAAFLELQGRQRPAYFSQKMLAREILRTLEPLDRLSYNPRETDANYYRNWYDRLHKSLMIHERRISTKNRTMFEETIDLLGKLRGLARNAGRPGGIPGSSANYNQVAPFNIFKNEHAAFKSRLKIAAGDIPPPKPKSEE